MRKLLLLFVFGLNFIEGGYAKNYRGEHLLYCKDDLMKREIIIRIKGALKPELISSFAQVKIIDTFKEKVLLEEEMDVGSINIAFVGEVHPYISVLRISRKDERQNFFLTSKSLFDFAFIESDLDDYFIRGEKVDCNYFYKIGKKPFSSGN